MKRRMHHLGYKHILFYPSLYMVFSLFFLTNTGLAATWYIKPSAEIPLRRGKGTDYRILAIVPDGTAVTINDEADSWARVSTTQGKEGWILKRFLTQEKPLSIVVASLQKKNAALTTELELLQTKNDTLEKANTALQKTLESNSKELEATTTEHQTLLEDASDVITIKKDLVQSKQAITKLQQDLDSLSAENKRLKASHTIKWFLAGGGTLILGCILGMILSKSTKRKSSLY